MELELEMMELQYNMQDICYNNYHILADDCSVQHSDFVRFSTFQGEDDAQQSAGTNPVCLPANLDQFLCNWPNHSAEFNLDGFKYAAIGNPLHHFHSSEFLDRSAVESDITSGQIMVPGRLMHCNSGVYDHDYNGKPDAGFSAEKVNNGSGACLQRPEDQNYKANPGKISIGEAISGGLSLEKANNEAAGMKIERYQEHSSSSSSKEEEKQKSTASGTLTSVSCKPECAKRDSKLKVQRGPHSTITTKRALPFITPSQRRSPIIIHTYSPKIIHTSPSKFMWLVQSLTGSSETRSQCLRNPPHDHHDRFLHATNLKASLEAQDMQHRSAYAPSHSHLRWESSRGL